MTQVKIYNIICSCGCEKKYIGSTKRELNKRMYNHRGGCNKGRTSQIYTHMREKGFDKFTIELLESLEVENEEEQRRKEQEYIIEHNTIENGLNERRAYTSPEIKKQLKSGYDRGYRERNLEDLLIKCRVRGKLRKLKPKIHTCEACNYSTGRIDTFQRHNNTLLHIRRLSDHVAADIEREMSELSV